MRSRLLAAFLAIAFAILVIQDIPLASYLRTVEHDRIMLSLERDAWTLADDAEPLVATRAFPPLASLADAYAVRTGARVDVVDANATVFASTNPGELGYDYSNRPEITTALSGAAVTGERGSTALGSRLLFVTVPIRSGTAIIGALRLTYPISAVDGIVSRRIGSILLVGVLTLLGAGLAAVMLAGAYTRRLRRIHAATEQLANGNLGARVTTEEGGAPELRGLEDAFNTMATRLQTLIESQQAFASDASHQLRTPLTALRLKLENTGDTIEDADATQGALDEAIVEVQRLQLLVDGLLALARLEGQAMQVEPVEVTAVIEERADLWGPLLEERDVTLQCITHGDLVALAVPGAVAQVLDNYLDNALEVAPAGSRITLRTDAHEHSIDIHVIDEGPGLDAAARARAFDRFWRGRADGSGTGLGLAIAARLAEVSGGSVHLDAPPEGGVDAVLTLRRA